MSGIVWLDEDGDGVRGGTEPGVAAVVVRLFSGDVEVAAATTAADGSYSFADVAPGDYTVEIEAPAGHDFAAANQGSDPSGDSDVTVVDASGDPLLGRVTVALSSGTNAGIADAGLLEPPPQGGGS